MKIEVSVEAGAAQRALAMLGGKLSGLTPVFRGIGAGVVADAQLRFKDGRDPYGKPWLPLKASTIKRRRKGSSQPLLDTGRLRNSISYRLLGNGVEIGTNVRYAAIHQFGGPINHAPRSIRVRLRRNKDGRSVFAKGRHKRVRVAWGTNSTGWTVKIPARPYLAVRERGLPREYGEIIRDQLALHLRGVAA